MSEHHVRPEVLLDSIVNVETMKERGKEQALLSGALKPQPADIEALTAHARSVARDSYTDEFSPDVYPQDRLRADDHERLLRGVDEAEIVEAHARGAAIQSERAVAEAPPAGSEPTIDPYIALLAIAVLTLSFAPTFHDRVFIDFESPWSSWFLSFVAGGFLASFLTWMMGYTIDMVGRAGVWVNALGATAGIGVGIACGVLRWSIVETPEGRLMTIGMTLIEICTVVYLEWLALSLRDAHARWRHATATIAGLTAVRNTDLAHLERCIQTSRELRARVAEHVRYVESRWIRHHKSDQIERTTIDAVIAGYHEGINQNCGFTRGLRRVS